MQIRDWEGGGVGSAGVADWVYGVVGEAGGGRYGGSCVDGGVCGVFDGGWGGGGSEEEEGLEEDGGEKHGYDGRVSGWTCELVCQFCYRECCFDWWCRSTQLSAIWTEKVNIEV